MLILPFPPPSSSHALSFPFVFQEHCRIDCARLLARTAVLYLRTWLMSACGFAKGWGGRGADAQLRSTHSSLRSREFIKTAPGQPPPWLPIRSQPAMLNKPGQTATSPHAAAEKGLCCCLIKQQQIGQGHFLLISRFQIYYLCQTLKRCSAVCSE